MTARIHLIDPVNEILTRAENPLQSRSSTFVASSDNPDREHHAFSILDAHPKERPDLIFFNQVGQFMTAQEQKNAAEAFVDALNHQGLLVFTHQDEELSELQGDSSTDLHTLKGKTALFDTRPFLETLQKKSNIKLNTPLKLPRSRVFFMMAKKNVT